MDEIDQLLAIEHGQPLAGIEHEGNACFMKLARMLQHAVTPIRRHNAQAYVFRGRDVIFMRAVHCSRMKSGYLVVGQVRGDERLGSERALHMTYMCLRQIEA